MSNPLQKFKRQPSINQSINGGIRRGARRLANPTTPNRGVPPG